MHFSKSKQIENIFFFQKQFSDYVNVTCKACKAQNVLKSNVSAIHEFP